MSKVIVVLDREEAELLARLTAGALIGSPTRTLNGPIHAALDRDPDALIEQVAKAISKAELEAAVWTDPSGSQPVEQHFDMAQAALAAITEPERAYGNTKEENK